MIEDVSVGQTIYVAGTGGMPFDPVGFVHEAVVDGVVPGYGIIRKVGGYSLPVGNENVYSSKSEACLSVIAQLRKQLEQISENYAAKISELESHCA